MINLVIGVGFNMVSNKTFISARLYDDTDRSYFMDTHIIGSQNIPINETIYVDETLLAGIESTFTITLHREYLLAVGVKYIYISNLVILVEEYDKYNPEPLIINPGDILSTI